MKKHSFLISLILTIVLFTTSCYESTDNDPGIFDGEGTITGKVLDNNGNGFGGVTVEYNGVSTLSLSDGYFELKDSPTSERGLVNFKKDGYASTQKIISIKDMRTTYVEASMYQVGRTNTFNPSSPFTVSYSGSSVEFQSNSIVDEAGNPFTGNVTVEFTYFNPTTDMFFDAFPGEFIGIEDNGDEVPIISYGFIDVELSNGNQKLQLAPGKPATIKMPIPTELQANAPATIPLWHYDVDKGQWIEFGSAEKIGNEYIGEVPHFSKINCDMKFEERSEVKGRVSDQDGNALINAYVKLKGVNFAGGGQGYTDENGEFHFINVKANDDIELKAFYIGFESDVLTVTTAGDGQIKENCNLEIFIDPDLKSGWEAVLAPDGYSISDIQFIDENTGWLACNGIYKTTDGGASWALQYQGEGENQEEGGIFRIQMLDENIGWSANYMNILYTSNGGNDWIEKSLEADSGKGYISDIFFIDEMSGWVAGHEIYKTTDGGITWNEIASGYGWGSKIRFLDQNLGLVSGNYGAIYRTIDGGTTWNKVQLSSDSISSHSNLSIYVFDSNNIWVFSSDYRSSDSRVFFSNDQGITFTEKTQDTWGRMYDMFFINQNEGWFVGDMGSIYHTTNAGSDWNRQFNKFNAVYRTVFFVNNLKGWAGGNNGNKSFLIYTETGGEAE